MIRHMVTAAAVCLLAACGPVAEESDQPGAPSSGEGAPTTAVTTAAGGQRPAAFAQCTVCHAVEPDQNRIGPSLAGVYGAKAGHVGDFAYSQAMRASGLTWDEPTLDRFLESPLKTVPGTKMSFAGLRNAEQRRQVIDYLKTL